ncbi:unnamed protein product [Closterium sp. NIES-53]
MTTLRVLLHVAAQRDYELHSLDFSTAFLQGSQHKEIWPCRPPGFTGSFFAALGFTPSTADPSLFLRTDTSLPPFYVLVYDLVFATTDTEALTLITQDRARRTITLTQSHMVHQVLQFFGFHFCSPQPTPLSTGHSLSAPPSDESVEPSGPYPELVGCLMYLMTCTRPNLAYPLSLLARYVAPGRHQKVHWDDAKRVLRYLCSTSGMGLVLRRRGPVVLTVHADASWVDVSATQRSSQGYTFSLGSGSVSWLSTCSSSVLSSSCENEIYARAMAAQELRWLTYLLTDLGEQPRSPPQRGQLRLAYVATRANTADIFTKALPPGDHQRFSTVLGLLALLFLTGLVTTCSPPLCLWGVLSCFVGPGRHRLVHWTAAMRVAKYLATTSGMGLVLGGTRPVELTGLCYSSYADDVETQRSTQEAEIYSGAMAAQELRWLTFLLADLGERPRTAPTLFADNKAMIRLCRKPRLETRVKHIGVQYFLLRELQRRGQVRLDFVASEANTADLFTKALAPGDHHRFCVQLGLVEVGPRLL